MVWRLASEAFREIRDALPGGQRTDGLIGEIRRERGILRTENARLRSIATQHASCPTLEDILAIVKRNEALEVNNRILLADDRSLKASIAAAGLHERGRVMQLVRGSRPEIQPED